MNAMRMIGFIRGRAQPQVIIQFGRDRLRGQVFAACPEEFPGKARGAGDAHRQGPPQQAAVHQFLEGLYRGTQPIECILETEPGVQTEDGAVLPAGIHHLLPFANGSGHRLFAEDILSGTGRFHRHDAVPVRRRGNVHDIHIRIMDQVPEIVIGL